MGSFNKAREKGVSGKAGSVATIAGIMGDMRGGASGKQKATQESPAPRRSGLYDPKTKSNFEEEIKKRKRKPSGASDQGGYGGSTILG
jgi:hypothetical protein